jgi:prolyl-tRNA synthetase
MKKIETDSKESKGITVKKEEDMPEWYSQVVLKAELAEYSPIKGCMVIRPYGYAIWQQITDFFNARLKKLKVQNAYFPMFIPESFFKKEAEHAKGFKPEVAWVQNKDEDSNERLALRPTSETIIYYFFSKWIRSWRDLPYRINQWCNIVRWEVSDVKLFIRSREFLWQEGHCAYETEEECRTETLMYLEEYRRVAEELLSIPVILGRKTEKEKFAGAKATYTIESLMPDGKSLQLGTSHELAQGFAKAFDIQFLGKDEQKHYPWQNSWGISTRMIGACVMMHSDNKGLVLPPRIASIKVVIVPIFYEKDKDKILTACKEIKKSLKVESEFDDREGYTPGWKFNEWELKGVPIRLELGPKDMEKDQVVLVRRDTGEKQCVKIMDVNKRIDEVLKAIQENLYFKAKKRIDENTVETKNWNEFMEFIKQRKLVKTIFCGEVTCEEEIKEKTGGATSRCIPFNSEKPNENCVHCGKKAQYEIYFSKNY